MRCRVLQLPLLFLTCAILLIAFPARSQDRQCAEMPGIVRIESNVPVPPPGWAALRAAPDRHPQ